MEDIPASKQRCMSEKPTRYNPTRSSIVCSPPIFEELTPIGQGQISQSRTTQAASVPSTMGSRTDCYPMPQFGRRTRAAEVQYKPQHAGHREGSKGFSAATTATLSTEESITVLRTSKRAHFDGFPDIRQPLPAGIQDEEIIRNWPNHLWGPLLLRIAAHWSPKEIGAMNAAKIKPNTFGKRMKYARKRIGAEMKETEAPSRVGAKRKRGLSPNNEEEQIDKEDNRKYKEMDPLPQQEEVESEASRAFRISQEEIQEAIIEKDPAFYKHQLTVRKKNAKRQRELLDQVIQERQAKKQRK